MFIPSAVTPSNGYPPECKRRAWPHPRALRELRAPPFAHWVGLVSNSSLKPTAYGGSLGNL
jgi:hypothetical protein